MSDERKTTHQCGRELAAKIVRKVYDKDHSRPLSELMNWLAKRWEHSYRKEDGELVVVYFDKDKLRAAISRVESAQSADPKHVYFVDFRNCEGGSNAEYHLARLLVAKNGTTSIQLLMCSPSHSDLDGRVFSGASPVCSYAFITKLLRNNKDARKINEMVLVERIAD